MSAKNVTILFDASSASTGPYAKKAFAIQCQTTITAVGLAPDDVITFEVLAFSDFVPGSDCICYPSNELPEIIGIQPLMCGDCDDSPVRVTANNPVVVLDAPQGALIRAHYSGSGIGGSRVWATSYGPDEDGCMHTQSLTPALRGCPEVCCEDETWTDTGAVRCNLATDEVEKEEISNCGTRRWVSDGPITWEETGQARCGPMQQTGSGIPFYVIEHQETSNCGDIRWTAEAQPVDAVPTGNFRCSVANDTDIEEEFQDQCGNTAWFDVGGAQTWSDACCTRCSGGNYERQEENQCGRTRWVVIEPVAWTPTGNHQCTSTEYQREERNQCGDTRWVKEDDLVWTATGNRQCVGGEYQREEANQCGGTRWVKIDDIVWTATGAERCGPSSLVEVEEINQCGGTRWAPTTRDCKEDQYIATLPLPCCGLAYRPTDPRDPAATVELEDCIGENVIGYIYPTPREGASVPVTADECDSVCCGSGDLLGFAVNPTGDCPSCKPPKPGPHAVEFIPGCTTGGIDVVLWSDGRYTPAYRRGLPTGTGDGEIPPPPPVNPPVEG